MNPTPQLFKNLSILLMVFFSKYPLSGQFNIMVGYNIQYCPLKETNAIFSAYNDLHTDITQKYDNFHMMNGMDIGLRYMMSEKIGIHADFINFFSGNNPSARNINGTITSYDWRINQRSISVGIENYYNSVGFGFHVGQTKWKYLSDVAGFSSKQVVFDNSHLYGMVNLILQVKSGDNAFALKPFYNFAFNPQDVSALSTQLNGTSRISGKENFSSFGLAIVFYNGPQR